MGGGGSGAKNSVTEKEWKKERVFFCSQWLCTTNSSLINGNANEKVIRNAIIIIKHFFIFYIHFSSALISSVLPQKQLCYSASAIAGSNGGLDW